MNYFWQINDGRVWSSAAADFVDISIVPPTDEEGGGGVIILYNDGVPADVSYLRETIIFYGLDLGVLKNRLEKIKDIQATYAPQLTLLQEAKAGAEMRDDTDDITDIKAEYMDLLATMNAEIQAVPADPT